MLLLFLGSVSHATEESSATRERVTDPQIKLLGKGFAGRKSREVISIACVGEDQGTTEKNCETLRFVHILNSSEVYYIGPAFKTNLVNKRGKPTSQSKQLKKAMKNLDDEVRNRRMRTTLSMYVSIVGIGAFSAVSGIFWPFGALLGVFVIAGAGQIDLIHIFDITNPIQNVMGKSTTQVQNQDGWNWGIKPKTISEKSFQNALLLLESPRGFFEDNTEFITITSETTSD